MKSLSALLFYLLLGSIALILSDIFKIPLSHVTPLYTSISLPLVVISGIALGMFVILISRFLDRFPVFSRLNATIAYYLPDLGFADIVLLSVVSSIGEEMLFRGALLQLLGIHISSLVFGFLHYGGKRTLLLWGIMGWIMGYLLGGLFLITGSLLAPILAHFTINYFNLVHITKTHISHPSKEIS